MIDEISNRLTEFFDDLPASDADEGARQMNDYMRYLICYDTPDNRRRRRMVAVLNETCERVQWSVFEGWMTAGQLTKLVQRLKREVDPLGDNVRIYRLCAYCQQEVNLLGVGEEPQLVRYWIV